jgi:uncharacterized membrane protein YsdA (DUF1294 family)
VYIQPGLIVEWMGPVSAFGFAAMGVDKLLAVGHHTRISERTFWLVALIGGFVGVLAGGLVFHHKTSKTSFWGPVLVAAVIWLVVIFYFDPDLGKILSR